MKSYITRVALFVTDIGKSKAFHSTSDKTYYIYTILECIIDISMHWLYNKRKNLGGILLMGNVPEANKGAVCMNNTAIGCKFIGWILLIIGSLLSFVMGVNYGDDVLGIIGAIASIVVGTLLIGIGEIIHLLSKMVNKNNGLG